MEINEYHLFYYNHYYENQQEFYQHSTYSVHTTHASTQCMPLMPVLCAYHSCQYSVHTTHASTQCSVRQQCVHTK